jgi:Short-chain dehydrogenases of various substrate specificities
MTRSEVALIVGVGAGLTASLARLDASEGLQVALAARDLDKLKDLVSETGAKAYQCNAVDPVNVENLFNAVSKDLGEPDIAIYNASNRVRGAITDLDPEAVLNPIKLTCYGGFLVARQAAKQMVERGHGATFFNGGVSRRKRVSKFFHLRHG